jgi:hypothetical protein
MLLQAAGVPALVCPVDPLFAGSLTAASRSSGRGDLFDVLRREIKAFHVGMASYQLRTPLLATFYPRVSGDAGRLSVTPSWLPIVGSGETLDDAWQDWVGQLHVRFQTLLAKRPWEMNADERGEWERIEQMVDVPAYRRETPYIVRQIGWVSRRRPIPDRIRWEDGRLERVTLVQMPPEFAALHEGDRFEAEVERQTVTGRLIRAVVVRRLPPLRQISTDEKLWSSLPTTAEAPAVEWDEFE